MVNVGNIVFTWKFY